MAYPFPRFANAPQTPQFIQGIESPRATTPRMSSARSGWSHKRLVSFFCFIIAILLWLFNPFSRSVKQTDKIPFSLEDINDYFANFEGHQECGIISSSLYNPSPKSDHHHYKSKSLSYCKNRAILLEALSGGGRHGFDAPFFPNGCHYRWYTTAEICMILDRFDAVVFIGDDMLRNVYAAFNMLLRENIALGGLRQWDLKDNERIGCHCDNQIMNSDCVARSVRSNVEVRENDSGSGHRSPYYCDRTPHLFLPISTSPVEALHSTLTDHLSHSPDSYKPIPIIHSLSLSTGLSWPLATASMDEWLNLADAASRNTPYLWVGPTAAGHLKPPGKILSEGNNALWHYTVEMAKEAKARGVEALGMYNMTLQAGSWNGSGYGMQVGLVQAMMIINWLSRLESS